MELLSKLPITEILIFIYVAWDVFKNIIREKNNDLKVNTQATSENTFHIRLLTQKMDALIDVPKDLNELHSKMRVMEERLNNFSKKTISN